MKQILITTVILSSLSSMLLVSQSSAQLIASTPQLESGKIESAPSVIVPLQLSGSEKYAGLQVLLNAPSKTLDGPSVLNEIRSLKGKLDFLNEPISNAVWKVINPNEEPFDDIYALFTLPRLNWTTPLREYAAGDESGEEPIYQRVNGELRNSRRSPSKDTIQWINGARAALKMLPRFEGISFRGALHDQARVDAFYSVGKLAVDAALLSSSIEPAIALKFADREVQSREMGRDYTNRIAVVFIIQGKTGRPVSTFALQHSHEEEILFANGTPMLVTAKSSVFQDSDLGSTQIIVMTEQ